MANCAQLALATSWKPCEVWRRRIMHAPPKSTTRVTVGVPQRAVALPKRSGTALAWRAMASAVITVGLAGMLPACPRRQPRRVLLSVSLTTPQAA